LKESPIMADCASHSATDGGKPGAGGSD
jgi:hypothetical protein